MESKLWFIGIHKSNENREKNTTKNWTKEKYCKLIPCAITKRQEYHNVPHMSITVLTPTNEKSIKHKMHTAKIKITPPLGTTHIPTLTNDRLNKPITHTIQSTKIDRINIVNSAYQQQTTTIFFYFHTTFGAQVVKTRIKAIDKEWFTSFQGLKSDAVYNYLPKPIQTTIDHMHQICKRIQPTSKVTTDYITKVDEVTDRTRTPTTKH